MNKITLKLFLLGSILLTNIYPMVGQCLPTGITFTSQSQIDDFPTDYPGCTEIGGTVFISGNVSNLNGLAQITNIGGVLKISYTTTLTNLDGLNNLQSAQSLLLEDNTSLQNIQALGNLTSLNRIVLMHNESLVTLSGLESITNIPMEINIQQNQALESLVGLQNLMNVGNSLSIYLNPQLGDLTGLESLTEIGSSLTIGENASLNTLQGLDNLSEIGQNFTLSMNPQLTTLANLLSLNSIAGDLLIHNQTNLINLNGLENLTNIEGFLNISVNNELSNIEGVKNIDATTITQLQIFQNENLSECAVQSVCDFLNLNPTNAVIDTNAQGCNSRIEVEDACALGNEENQIAKIIIFPNPTNGTFEISGLESGAVRIIDSQGRTVKKLDLGENSYSISELSAGIYFIKITSENSSVTKQLIKYNK